MVAQKSRYNVAANSLSLMQELVRKDPDSYKEEFIGQCRHFEQLLNILKLQTEQFRMSSDALVNIVKFLSTVSPLYPDEAKKFALNITMILRNRGSSLDPVIRIAFSKALIPLRNKKAIADFEVFQLFFELIKINDKNLRKFLFASIVAQIKRLECGRKDRKLSTTMQSYTFAKLNDSRSVVCRTAQLVLIDAYRKNYWRNAKTANAIAECCFHRVSKMQEISGEKVATIKFFLGSAKNESDFNEDESDDDRKENSKSLREITTSYHAVKKTKKKAKQFEKAKKALDKEHKSRKETRIGECNFLALNDIFDPQLFADRLFRHLESKKSERFEIRLMQMALLARIIGIHKLQTLGFYSFLHRYLKPKQREVTLVLLYCAQATHSMVPPDTVEQLVRVIVDNFIGDRNSSEAITVGLNAVREILGNCPLAATQQLMEDLTQYKKYKNKNVSMSAKGLITLFRTINPKLLHRKDRGRPTEAIKELEPLVFGAISGKSFVPGTECLPERDREEIGSESESDDDSWVDLHDSDENDIKKSQIQAEDIPSSMEGKIEKAKIVSEMRIFTQEEHRKIAIYQLRKQLEPGKNAKKRKLDDRKLEEEFEEKRQKNNQSNELSKLADIEHFHKKIGRQTKGERMEMVQEGREGRDQFNKPKKRGPHVGRTNRELAKRKNFQMVKQKHRGEKRQRSFRDQQESLKKYLKKQKGAK